MCSIHCFCVFRDFAIGVMRKKKHWYWAHSQDTTTMGARMSMCLLATSIQSVLALQNLGGDDNAEEAELVMRITSGLGAGSWLSFLVIANEYPSVVSHLIITFSVPTVLQINICYYAQKNLLLLVTITLLSQHQQYCKLNESFGMKYENCTSRS